MPVAPRPPLRFAPGPRAIALAVALAAGCLPADERPPPGVVSVWLEGAEGLEARAPFVTDDGWSITFDRVIVASSGVEDTEEEGGGESDGGGVFDSDDGGPRCAFYYETEMRAVYDVVAPGPRLLGHFGALGECAFEVDWGRLGPSPDVLGPGVSTDDVRAIVTRFLAAGARGAPGLYVQGVASKGERRKSFAWPFSPRFLSGACGRAEDAPPFRRQFDANAALDAVVTVHPRWLFADAAARFRFDPVADTDDLADGDGEVTRTELEKRALAELSGGDGAYAWPAAVPPPADPVTGPRQASQLDFINLQAGHVLHNDGLDPCAGPFSAE